MSERVYIVYSSNKVMSVCGDRRTADWKKRMCEDDGNKNVCVKSSGVLTHSEEFMKLNKCWEEDE